MKLPPSNLLWCVLIVCLTLLAFTYLTALLNKSDFG
ncbi:small toxic polypeptide [Klebsiella quasivariicola]|uniref:Small toxic polypeptide n=1 Tax=Klebsiella quasivariicola TaxID=2026240 RepID=A0ABY6XCV6_9ENTR|nr:small toxic polypeptide [Klebsiella quasivariicola]